MVCSWCGQGYTEPSIYHICDDGTTFAERSVKNNREFEEHRLLRLRVKSNPESNKNYDEIKWTPYDLRLLEKAKIKP